MVRLDVGEGEGEKEKEKNRWWWGGGGVCVKSKYVVAVGQGGEQSRGNVERRAHSSVTPACGA